MAEDLVEVGGAGGEVGVEGAEFAAVDDEAGAEVEDGLHVSGGADGAAPGLSVLAGGGGDFLLHVKHGGIVDGGGAAEAQGHVARAEEEDFDAGDGGDFVDVFEGLRGLDLDDEEGLAVGLLGVVGGLADPEAGIAAAAAEAAVTEGWEFDGVHQNARFIRSGDMGDHEAGGAVFEEAVEAVFFLGGRTPDAVDIGGVMAGDHGIDLTRLPGAVLAIHPDAVVVEVGGDGGEEADGRAAAADAGDLTGAELGENFGGAHEEENRERWAVGGERRMLTTNGHSFTLMTGKVGWPAGISLIGVY